MNLQDSPSRGRDPLSDVSLLDEVTFTLPYAWQIVSASVCVPIELYVTVGGGGSKVSRASLINLKPMFE